MNTSKVKPQSTFMCFLIMLFLNSFVDLGHKIIIQNTVFKVYDGQQQIILIAVVNSLILLPYVLLFTPAAYFSNRFALVRVMRISAWVAFACSLLITYFYYQGWYQQAFVMTLVLAIQSAIYSPAKYGYIKQLMGEKALVTANAKVSVATIVAILSGTLIFSVLFEWMLKKNGLEIGAYTKSNIILAIAPLGWILVVSTLFELLMAYRLPHIRSQSKSKPLSFQWQNYFSGRSLSTQIKSVTSTPRVFYSILGLSVFWGLSQMVLAAFPAYAKQHLLENNTAIIQAILACSGLGIFMGSSMVARFSKRILDHPSAINALRMQLIPTGAVGVALSLAIIPFIDAKIGLAMCFFGVGFFGAFFMVPLNAIIQSFAKPEQVGTILASNNWMQNISMLSFLGLTILSALGGFNSVWLFYLIAVLAAVASLFYLRHGFRDFMQFVFGGLFHLRYKITPQAKQQGIAAFPEQGAVLLLGNHISWIDWALVQLAVPRPIRFVIDKEFYDHWLLHGLLKHINTIPISPKRSKEAIKQIQNALKNGDVICLFPEGRISEDGELNQFKAGFELSIRNTDVNIIPFYIQGMQGSRLSRVAEPRASLSDVLLLRRRKIKLIMAEPIKTIKAAELEEKVFGLSRL